MAITAEQVELDDGRIVAVTASIGLACLTAADTADTLLERANMPTRRYTPQREGDGTAQDIRAGRNRGVFDEPDVC